MTESVNKSEIKLEFYLMAFFLSDSMSRRPKKAFISVPVTPKLSPPVVQLCLEVELLAIKSYAWKKNEKLSSMFIHHGLDQLNLL